MLLSCSPFIGSYFCLSHSPFLLLNISSESSVRLCLLWWADSHRGFQVRSLCPGSFLFCSKRLLQCHWSILCLCRCRWGVPSALVTAGAMSVFAFGDIYHIFKQFCSSSLLLPSTLYLTSLFQVGHQQHYWLLSPLPSVIQGRLSRTCCSYHLWVAFKSCSRNLPFNLTYASKLPT